MRAARNEKGMVLLLVLVVVALLASLVTEFAFSTLVDMRLTETFRDGTRAWYLAKGGVEAGKALLEYDLNKNWDHPIEPWGVGVPSYPVGEEGVVSIAIEDLSARLNVNDLVNNGMNPDPVIMDRFNRLFTNVGLANADELVDALIDWIDTDQNPQTDGAESSYYQGLEHPYHPHDGYMDSLDELPLVKGFTLEVRQEVERYLAAYPPGSVGSKQVNINTASAEVLKAADDMEAITDQIAADIISRRETAPFERVNDLNSISGLSTIVQAHFTVKSAAFRIITEAAVNDGTKRAVAVVSKDARGKYQIRYLKVD